MTESRTPAKVFTAKGLATRARIVAVAANLMFERGVAATAIEDVQRRAGVSGSQMYHYFTDKKDLIQAVVAHQAAAAVHAQLAMGPLDSVEALQAWVDFHLALQRERNCVGGCALGSLVSQVAESDPVAREELDAGFTAWEQPIAAGLQMMQDRGELSAGADPRQLGVAAIAALEGGLLLTQIQRSLAPLESALTTFLSYVQSVAKPKAGDVDGGAHQ